jgi:transaldolase
MAALLDLARRRQSVWFDFIGHNLVACGAWWTVEFAGVTTNASIFNQAIGASRDYDEAIRELLEQSQEIGAA